MFAEIALILPGNHGTDRLGLRFVSFWILLENQHKFYSSKTKSWYKSKKPKNATIDFNEIDNLINLRLSASVMD